MKDNGGKVILALLAGASAGIVAGLLMAPEAGTATRETWGKSLGKFGDDLNKILQDGLAKLDGLKGGESGGDNADRSGAEDALAGLGGKSSGSKGGGGRKASGGSSSADAGTVDGPNSASTATYSQGSGSPDNGDAGGTIGGSGVGS